MKDVTFVIPNRGGEHVDEVIKNFKSTFKSYFDSIDFLVVEQDDDNIFRKGQLYNAAMHYVNTEYVGLLDNDIINLDKFDPVGLYNEIGGAYLAFDKISQLRISSKNKYEVIYTEPRLYGHGAFVFMKTKVFYMVNGFSNLCFGWGSEDDIFDLRVKMKRYVHTLGHIQHERRNNLHPELRDFNREIYFAYKNGEIFNSIEDGYLQTTFDVSYDKTKKGVRYVGIKNISVVDDYKYIDKYNEGVALTKAAINVSNGVTVCISAYKSKDTIKETLDSVYSQTYFKNNPFEVIVGIDGCNETLEYIKTIMGEYKNLRVLMMDSNKGTYITCNTIFSEAKYNYIVRFDSDDIMLPDYVERGISFMGRDVKYVRMGFRNTNEANGHAASYGSIIIRKDLFMSYGGYMPWICAADYELYERLKNVTSIKLLNEVCFFRRVRSNSLQFSKETGMKSKIREKYHEYIKNESPKHPYIKMITNDYTVIYSNCEYAESVVWTNTENEESVSPVYEDNQNVEKTIKCYIADNKVMSKASTMRRAFSKEFVTEVIDAPFRIYSKFYKSVISRCEESDFVLLIKSNVSFDRMDEFSFNRLMKEIKRVAQNKELGIWSASIYTGNMPLKSSCKMTGKLRENSIVSDQFVLIRSSLLKGMHPNFIGCNSASGFIEYLSKKSTKMGFKNYVDDRYSVYLYTNVENDRNTLYRDEGNRFLRNNPL